jgi:hypothetical protein
MFDGLDGPAPLYGAEDGDNLQEWVTTPLLNMLQGQGWGIQIYEGIYWPQSRRIFEDFAPILWAMRQHMRKLMESSPESEHYALNYMVMKQIIVSFFGMFASEKNRSSQYLRRDIWSAVVEAAKANMFYNIEKIHKEKNLWPVAVYTDCLVYVCGEPDADLALGSIMGRAGELGGYKLKWSLPVGTEVLHALGQNEASEMMYQLNGLARQQEATV